MGEVSKEEIIEEIENEKLVMPKALPILFFNKRTRKTTQLINNSVTENEMRGRHTWFDFILEEPMYIESVIVHTTNYSTYAPIEFKWTNIEAVERSQKERKKNEKYVIDIGEFISELSFRPDSVYLSLLTPKIIKVEFLGYTKSDFVEVCNQLSRLDSYKEDITREYNAVIEEAEECQTKIDSFETEEKEYTDKIFDLREETKEIEAANALLTDETDKYEAKISSLKNAENSVRTRVESLDDSIDQKNNQKKKLNVDISDKMAELKSLKENINMFPSEIKGFVDQGASNIGRYTILAAVPIFVLLAVMGALFTNAADLTLLYKSENEYEILSVFITRLPYVAIALTLIHACYKIAKIFIAEIMKINQQRLNLAKISIVATDVSSASGAGLDINDNDLYQLRTQLKMELLREHLKGYLPKDYSYEKNSILNSSDEEAEADFQQDEENIEEE